MKVKCDSLIDVVCIVCDEGIMFAELTKPYKESLPRAATWRCVIKLEAGGLIQHTSRLLDMPTMVLATQWDVLDVRNRMDLASLLGLVSWFKGTTDMKDVKFLLATLSCTTGALIFLGDIVPICIFAGVNDWVRLCAREMTLFPSVVQIIELLNLFAYYFRDAKPMTEFLLFRLMKVRRVV